MLTLEISNKRLPDGGRIILTTWPSDAGQLPSGEFDVDAWEGAQAFFIAAPGDDLREAFRAAYRMARIEARKHGGLEFTSGCDEEPIPFPDLEPDALRAPAVIVDDGGPSYRIQVKLSGEELLELGWLGWREQLGRLRALVSETLESGKSYAEFEAGVKEIFPGGFAGNC